MTQLASETIALRAALCWICGFVGMVWISGYCAMPTDTGTKGYMAAPKLSERNSCLSLMALLVTKTLLLLGPTGVAILVARATVHLEETISKLLAGLALVGSLWASMILLQFAQNLAYRWVGAPLQPIRWTAMPARRRKRKRRGSASSDRV